MKKYIFILAVLIASVILCSCDPEETLADPQTRWYVQAQVEKTNLIGAHANIVTRLPKLADPSIAEGEQFSIAYCGLASLDGTKSAQIGYGSYRLKGFALTMPSFYCEVVGEDWQVYWSAIYPSGPHGDDPPYPPEDNEDYEYELELEPSGQWLFSYDGIPILNDIGIDNYWAGDKKASFVTWTGEITCKENDMPGRLSAAPCTFSNLQVKKKDGNYSDVLIPSQCSSCMVFSNDDSQWNIEWDTANTYVLDVEIYDLDLLP